MNRRQAKAVECLADVAGKRKHLGQLDMVRTLSGALRGSLARHWFPTGWSAAQRELRAAVAEYEEMCENETETESPG